MQIFVFATNVFLEIAMKFANRYFLASLILAFVCTNSITTAQVYGPGDPVLAVDLDGDSSFPPGETPFNAADQDSNTKYLNFGGRDTGFIVTPNSGPSIIQSIQMTTANDAEERDPTEFIIYGTNDPITSADNSLGDQENWTEIASGTITMPADRFAASDIVDFTNSTSYSSYKVIIDEIKDKNFFGIMQVADVQLYTAPAGGGDQILAAGDFAIACNNDPADFSLYPVAEVPTNVIDGTLNKYLNFGFLNSGFIIRRADNAPVIIDGFTITTANDFFERDPTSFELYGTNDPVTSAQNSTGGEENWTLVATDVLALPEDRDTESAFVSVDNSAAFSAYRVIFPTSRAPANSIQIAEMTFNGKISDALIGDVNCDGVIDLLDVAPFVDILTTGGFSVKADINQDGVVDLLDVSPFVDLLTGP